MENSVNPQARSSIRRFLDGLYALGGALSACAVFIILILMIGASIGRQLDWRVSWINDVVAWLCASAAFFGMAYSFRNGDFVRVTLLLESVSPAVRRWMEFISLAIAFIAISYLGYWATLFTYQSWEFNDVSQGQIIVPLWIPQIFTAIGCLIFFLAVLDELLRVLRGDKPRYQQMAEDRLSAGDFGETL